MRRRIRYHSTIDTKASKQCRSISHPWSRVTSGGGAASLLAGAGRIACKDARLFKAFPGPWPPSSTFYKRRDIEPIDLGIPIFLQGGQVP